MNSKKVRFGIIGIGNMGSAHVHNVRNAARCELRAVCDRNAAAFDRIDPAIRTGLRCYNDAGQLFADPEIDAVLIAVPHYFHPDLTIAALRDGKHVLVEKPIAVHKAEALRLIAEAAKYPDLVKALMFNQRTQPAHRKLKELLGSGELGAIRRITWIVTDWFRTQSYYDSGDWRASWRGEGGGVLLNQCPHQLELFQWFFGMPDKVRATVKLGKYHDIEVEDEVNAFLEYADGKTANFISTTGEAPGVNRLEIAAERGLLTLEKGQLHLRRNEFEMGEYIRTSPRGFAAPECWNCEIPIYAAAPNGHQAVIENLAAAILEHQPLIAPLAEGVRGLELGNAMLYSGLNDLTVKMPLDAEAYAAMLCKLVQASRWRPKNVAAPAAEDFSKSF